MKKISLLLFLFLLALPGCEKDDICDSSTPTTPRLVIEFYDKDTALLKNVTDLKVTGTGAEEPIVFNDALTDDTRYLTSGNKIMLPLKVNGDNAQYTLTLYSGNDILEISDVVDLNYTRTSEYVSRACGFKTLFKLNPDVVGPTSPFIINDTPGATAGNWIRNVEIIKTNLENENETHVKIYF